MTIEFDGFDELQDELDQMQRKANELEGEHEVPLGELLDAGFMRQFTEFESIDAFFDASPWTVEAQEDFRDIPDDELDEFVHEHTRFDSWDDMLGRAGAEYFREKLTE